MQRPEDPSIPTTKIDALRLQQFRIEFDACLANADLKTRYIQTRNLLAVIQQSPNGPLESKAELLSAAVASVNAGYECGALTDNDVHGQITELLSPFSPDCIRGLLVGLLMRKPIQCTFQRMKRQGHDQRYMEFMSRTLGIAVSLVYFILGWS
jgi:hypothetical protein